MGNASVLEISERGAEPNQLIACKRFPRLAACAVLFLFLHARHDRLRPKHRQAKGSAGSFVLMSSA